MEKIRSAPVSERVFFFNSKLKQHEFHSNHDLARATQNSRLNQYFPDFLLDVSFSNKSFYICLLP